MKVLAVVLVAAVSLVNQITVADAGCSDVPGDHVVINVPWDDPDGGLLIVDEPRNNGARIGVIPSVGVGVTVSTCNSGGWCRVRYNCMEGWAYAARYLAPQNRTLASVVGVSPSDPEGLNVRNGPAHTFNINLTLPYNATGLIKHHCQPSLRDGSQWCLITANSRSGWVAGNSWVRTPAKVQSPRIQFLIQNHPAMTYLKHVRCFQTFANNDVGNEINSKRDLSRRSPVVDLHRAGHSRAESNAPYAWLLSVRFRCSIDLSNRGGHSVIHHR